MPNKKRKFIDKKNAVTFRLVHRSQKDPLVADERAPKHVLFDFTRKEDDAAKKRKEEQSKYGIYFDDEYDYLQHLKDVNSIAYWEPVSGNSAALAKEFETEQILRLPSSVFPSAVEESEGLLNKAAPRKGPRPDWDPDIVAALDDDFDFDDPSNELDDNFMVLANAECDDEDEMEMENSVSEDDFDNSFGEEETKSHFTNYSMSSSVISRNKGLQMLDEQFEKLYEMYEEDEIGALDGEDISGFVHPDSNVMQNLLKEYEQEREERSGRLKDLIQKCANSELANEEDSNDEELVKMAVFEDKKEDRWDCESILSNYSNLYNHPKLIIEPKQKTKVEVSCRSGLPKDILRSKGLTKYQLKKLDDETLSTDDEEEENKTTISTVRLPNETPEERRARKAIVRQMRKERRIEKKANKVAFKVEEKRQAQVMNNLKQNLQGIKLM